MDVLHEREKKHKIQCEVCDFADSSIIKVRSHARKAHLPEKVAPCDECFHVFRGDLLWFSLLLIASL